MNKLTYKNEEFILDGQPFKIYSGAIHYFRMPSEKWKDRLLKLKECGFNTVETYIPWNLHEPEEGSFVFDGDLDICKFIDLANDLGLKVILRPGPYICAEWENGGLPYWLLRYNGIRVRSDDEVFLKKVSVYMKVLCKILESKFSYNGGNVILVQVENEYSSYGNSLRYIDKLRRIFIDSGVKCNMFYADGSVEYCLSGFSSDALPTFATFGSRVEENMMCLKKYHKNQPLMCMEFWCGWFDHWHEEHNVRDVSSVMSELERFLDNDWSFNFYMFFGGTNFGFMNGANQDGESYRPVVTSYDYCAPLSESGDRTELYYRIRDLFIKKGIPVPELTAKDSEKMAYGKVKFDSYALLEDNYDKIGKKYKSDRPLFMEECGQDYGYIVYSTEFAGEYKDCPLFIDGLGDRAIIFINGKKVAVYEKGRKYENYLVNASGKNKLDILVENCGRVNYGKYTCDKKGIQDVRIGLRFISDWTITTLRMNNPEGLKFIKSTKPMQEKPCFYHGEIFVNNVADSFLRLDGFGKGFVSVNWHNLGRYYTIAGPQKTLYVPSCWLMQGKNEIIVFDSDGTTNPYAEFVDKPILG